MLPIRPGGGRVTATPIMRTCLEMRQLMRLPTTNVSSCKVISGHSIPPGCFVPKVKMLRLVMVIQVSARLES